MTGPISQVVRDVRIPSRCLATPEEAGTQDGTYRRGDLLIRDGRVAGLAAAAATAHPRVLLPTLTEAHCHLDKCYTLDRLRPFGGDLMDAIAAQSEDKAHWTADDLRRRAQQGLQDARTAGCGALRSHIDWGVDAAPPLSWQVLTELRDDQIALQWAALTGIEHMANPDFAQQVARTVAQTHGGVLGSFILGHPKDAIQDGLRQMIRWAEAHNLALDFHVDETLDNLDGVEAIADAVLETGFQGPVLCGHAVALSVKPTADFERIADKLARAGITICALPSTNLYLQGRTGGTPVQRGLTRVRELQQAGVRVILGTDNVRDAFCPIGQHDPREALRLGCLTCHLDPDFATLLPMITTDAAAAMGRAPGFVDHAAVTDLLISPASDIGTVVADLTPPRRLDLLHDADVYDLEGRPA